MTSKSPSKIPERIIHRLYSSLDLSDLIGDFEEVYHLESSRGSRWIAEFNYWWSCLRLCFSYTLKKRQNAASFHAYYSTQNKKDMIKNYIIVAFRNLKRHRFFTVMNIAGLAIGMSISLLLIGLLSDIMEYDDFHSNKNNIYRVYTKVSTSEGAVSWMSSPAPVLDYLKENVGSELKGVLMNNVLYGKIDMGIHEFDYSGLFVEPSFFDLFSFKVREGDPKLAWKNRNNIAITETLSTRLFKDQSPIGKTLLLKGFGQYNIVAVLEDPPKKSHIKFDVLGVYEQLKSLEAQNIVPKGQDDWFNYKSHFNYLVLESEEEIEKVNTLIGQLKGQSKIEGENASYKLQDISYSFLDDGMLNSLGPQWGVWSMLVFFVLAMMILVPACFNYANISISRAMQRAKEIGVRKVIGSSKKQIFYQFITETILVCLFSFLLAFVMFLLIKDEFIGMLAPASAAGVSLEPNWFMLSLFLGFVLFTGFISGLFPALYFSKIQPILALKGSFNTSKLGKFNLKKILLAVQFTFSSGFILGIIVLFNQYQYSINYDLGFNKNQIVNIPIDYQKAGVFEARIKQLSQVQSISYSSSLIGVFHSGRTQSITPSLKDSIGMDQIFVTKDFFEMHQLSLVAGELLDQLKSNDTLSVVINETYSKSLGYSFPIEAIGKEVVLSDGSQLRIIGVIKDFHHNHLRFPITNLGIRNNPNKLAYINILTNSNNTFAVLNTIEKEWKQSFYDTPFKATFLSKDIEDLYKGHYYIVKITGFLGLLAISISCLGLLGMVVFTVQHKVKEIGIRKIMGASIYEILFTLSKQYLYLMLIGVAIGIPISYLIFDFALQRIQYYSFEIGAGSIFSGIGLMLVIGLLTLSTQVWKAARANPSDALKYE